MSKLRSLVNSGKFYKVRQSQHQIFSFQATKAACFCMQITMEKSSIVLEIIKIKRHCAVSHYIFLVIISNGHSGRGKNLSKYASNIGKTVYCMY